MHRVKCCDQENMCYRRNKEVFFSFFPPHIATSREKITRTQYRDWHPVPSYSVSLSRNFPRSREASETCDKIRRQAETWIPSVTAIHKRIRFQSTQNEHRVCETIFSPRSLL